ncbi:MAG: polyphosphate kinase 2 family protein [Gammaproteobacteria bacterium]|nr:polyphosphate kinase 2 family protein [Gammaproteobacteria bacterium]
MFEAIPSPYLVPFDDSFVIKNYPTAPPKDGISKHDCKKRLDELSQTLSDLQRVLYAQSKFAMLLIFQAMDAAGKDSTIRAVMDSVDPNGCQVYSFQAPGNDELKHDFIWRTVNKLPPHGRIGIFNRSYYEEVLIAKVHPELLERQKIKPEEIDKTFWNHRYESIVDHEKHLARNRTVVLKFWLNLSKKEQKSRFLSRIDEPQKNWKFCTADINERQYWKDYMHAYETAISKTSRSWAPWYAIPADNKPFMRMCVADIIVASLRSLALNYPRLGPNEYEEFKKMRSLLENE